jgi:hypothetical protein
MLAMPNNLAPIACARCGDAMQFVRSVPRLDEFPELRVFVCPSCGDVETKAAISAPQRFDEHL